MQCSECSNPVQSRVNATTCGPVCSTVRNRRITRERWNAAARRRPVMLTTYKRKPDEPRELKMNEIALPAGPRRRALAAAFLADPSIRANFETFMENQSGGGRYFDNIDGFPLFEDA